MAHQTMEYRFNILDYKNRTHAAVKYAFRETIVAEWNFNAVRQAARHIANDTLLGRLCGPINIRQLEDLIDDLICLHRILRRNMLQNHSFSFDEVWQKHKPLSPKQLPAAHSTATVPPRLTDVNHYRCLCPLTVLLQIIARSLTKMRLDSMSPNLWGSIKPLREVLVRLQKTLIMISKENKDGETVDEPEFPGFAACIMLHEEHSHFTVTSTAPSYQNLLGLNTWGRKVRFAHLGEMLTRCSKESANWIENMESLSKTMITNFKVAGGRRMPEFAEWVNPFEDKPERTAAVGGLGASFTPGGAYKLACIVDYWRFEMEMPPEAKGEERRVIMSCTRGNGTATSCAEWELWVHKLSRPAIRPLPPQQRLPMREGMAKSETWRVPDQRQDPRAPSERGAENISRQQILDRQFQSSRQPVAVRTFPDMGQRKPTPEITHSMIARSGAHLIEPRKGSSARASDAQSYNSYAAQRPPAPRPTRVDQISPTNTFLVQRPPPEQDRPRPQQQASQPEKKGSFKSRFLKF